MMFFEKRGGAPSWASSAHLSAALPVSLMSAGGPDIVSAATEQMNSPPPPAALQHSRKFQTCSRDPSSAALGSPPDNSLTSLGWLQNLKGLDLFSPEVRSALQPPSPSSEDGGSSWETVSSSSASPPCGGDKNDPLLSFGAEEPSPLRQCVVHSTQFRSAPKRYRSDSSKPPFSHISLVYLAIQHSRTGKASLHEICRWIKTNFKFFKEAEPGWQDGIKQSLLRNDLFVKVPRINGESSNKGLCWTIHPQLVELLEKDTNILPRDGAGVKKLKRAYSYGGKEDRQSRGGRGRKRIKSEAQAPIDPCGLPGDLDWISLLSSQRVSCGSYGSPVLGPPDLGQVGDPMICSPLVVPTSINTNVSPTTPATRDPTLDRNLKVEKDVEDVFSNHTTSLPSLSTHLLPWDESRPQSPPNRHPWAESRETTLKSLGRQHQTVSLSLNHSSWFPKPYPSSSSSSSSFAARAQNHRRSRTAENHIY